MVALLKNGNKKVLNSREFIYMQCQCPEMYSFVFQPLNTRRNSFVLRASQEVHQFEWILISFIFFGGSSQLISYSMLRTLISAWLSTRLVVEFSFKRIIELSFSESCILTEYEKNKNVYEFWTYSKYLFSNHSIFYIGTCSGMTV